MIKSGTRKKFHRLRKKAFRHVKKNAWKHRGKISLGLLAAGLIAGTGGLLWATQTILAENFYGPTCSAGSCGGALGVDSNYNLAIGTSTPIPDSKLFILTSSTQSAGFAIKVLSPGGAQTTAHSGITRGGPLFLVRNDGKISLGGFIGDTTTSSIVLTGNTRVDGVLHATAFSGTMTGNTGAENVAAGAFGAVAGTGNYSFPASVSIGASTFIPYEPLYVVASSSFKASIGLKNIHPTSRKAELTFYNSEAVGGGWAIATDYWSLGNDDFVIWGGGSGAPRMYFESAGDISVGNTTAEAKLDVWGTFRAGSGRFEVDASGDLNDPGGSIIGINDSLTINSPGILTVAGTATSSFAGPLTVNGRIYSSSGGFRFPDGTIQTTAATGGGTSWTRSGTNVILSTSTDNVAIGASSAAGKLDVNSGGSNTNGYFLNGRVAMTSGDTWLRLNQSSEFTSGVYTPGLSRADNGFDVAGYKRLSSSGGYTTLMDGVADPAIYLGSGDPANYYDNTTHYFRANDHVTTFATINSAGIYGNAFFYNSDSRLKTDLKPVAGLEIIKSLNGYTFRWKNSGKADVGLIAQEVESVLPQAVSTDEKTGLKSLNAGALMGPLVESIKELNAKVEKQASRIGELEAEINELRK